MEAVAWRHSLRTFATTASKVGDKDELNMRNISFSITLESFNNRTKTVTRRLGWSFLKPGDVLMGVEKAQGIKKGELKRLHEIVKVGWQPLEQMHFYGVHEVTSEGFSSLSVDGFINMFCSKMDCTPDTMVNRIEFKHL